MHYFKQKNYSIMKYNVTIDRQKIEKIRKSIINSCSMITHYDYESEISPKHNQEFMKNYTEARVGYKDYYEGYEPIYRFSYDLLTPPHLVKLIDRLMNDDASVIDEIINYNYKSEINLNSLIKTLREEIKNMDDDQKVKKVIKLEELDELVKNKELNKNRKSTKAYHEQLLKYIVFELMDSKNFIQMNDIKSFLDIDLSIQNGVITTEKQKNKVKQKK